MKSFGGVGVKKSFLGDLRDLIFEMSKCVYKVEKVSQIKNSHFKHIIHINKNKITKTNQQNIIIVKPITYTNVNPNNYNYK